MRASSGIVDVMCPATVHETRQMLSACWHSHQYLFISVYICGLWKVLQRCCRANEPALFVSRGKYKVSHTRDKMG